MLATKFPMDKVTTKNAKLLYFCLMPTLYQDELKRICGEFLIMIFAT